MNTTTPAAAVELNEMPDEIYAYQYFELYGCIHRKWMVKKNEEVDNVVRYVRADHPARLASEVERLSDARNAYEILTPNIEAEIHSAEGPEADEMKALWDIIGNALTPPVSSVPKTGCDYKNPPQEIWMHPEHGMMSGPYENAVKYNLVVSSMPMQKERAEALDAFERIIETIVSLMESEQICGRAALRKEGLPVGKLPNRESILSMLMRTPAATDIKIIRALLSTPQQAAPDGWQPIETAPKDGTKILGTNGEWLHTIYWSNYRHTDDNYWNSGGIPFRDATHWMPLPAAPDAQGGE